MFDSLRYLLLQIRNADDPMRENEVRAFCRVLGSSAERVLVGDLLTAPPSQRIWDKADVVLLGGSGHYSAAGEGEWLERALDVFREVHAQKKPMFASCWGFQAVARAMGGKVVKDLARAEVGTHELWLTDEGEADPVFGSLGSPFQGQMGHEDCVVELPPGATRLAYSELVENQAYCFEGLPIYCTQFHPELNRNDLLGRVKTYPEYISRIANMPTGEFCETIQETPETELLLPRFLEMVFGQ